MATRWSETKRVLAALRALPLGGEFTWGHARITREQTHFYSIDICDGRVMSIERVVEFLSPEG